MFERSAANMNEQGPRDCPRPPDTPPLSVEERYPLGAGPAVGTDLNAGEVPGEAGVERARLAVVPHPQGRQHRRDDTVAVPGRVVGRQRPGLTAVPRATAAVIFLQEIGVGLQ